MRFQRNVIIALVALVGLFLIGVVGYGLIEGGHSPEAWTVFDSVFMTVITLTTVGYGDEDMSQNGRIFTVFLLIGGFGVFAYSITLATAFIVEGGFIQVLRRRKMESGLAKYSNHYVICGLGNTGVHALDELLRMEEQFVAIECEDARIQNLLDSRHFSYVCGDATDDEVLIHAGVKRATGLITCLSKDKDNLFVVLSARELNSDLRIVSKAIDDNTPPKLLKAGAADVVLSDQIDGMRLASRAVRSDVVDFLDTMLKCQQVTRFSESVIRERSELIGLTLSQARIQDRTGLVTMAVRNRQGEFIYNPGGTLKLNLGSALIVIADNEQLEELNKITGDS